MAHRGFTATLALLVLLGAACTDESDSNVAPPTTEAEVTMAPCPESVIRRVDGGDPGADALPPIERSITDRGTAVDAFEDDREALRDQYGATTVELAEGFGRAWTGEPGYPGIDYTVVDVDDFGIVVMLPTQETCPSGVALHVQSDAGLPLFFMAPTQPG